MTATERLRQLLDERGVEWWNDTDPEPQHVTVVHFEERIVIFHENVNGTMGYHVYNTHDLTPEQAVEATLGRGTCHIRGGECDQCGAHIHKSAVLFWVPVGEGMRTVESREVHYCPNCGRMVDE